MQDKFYMIREPMRTNYIKQLLHIL